MKIMPDDLVNKIDDTLTQLGSPDSLPVFPDEIFSILYFRQVIHRLWRRCPNRPPAQNSMQTCIASIVPYAAGAHSVRKRHRSRVNL